MRLLVIFHIYYHKQVDWFISKMKNINCCEWDLIVTSHIENDVTKEIIREFNPKTQFVHVDNIGYDVLPFINVLKTTDLNRYDCILKIHTKNTDSNTIKLNGIKLTGYRWRDYLVNSLLKSPEQFRSCIELFENDAKCGMVCSDELYVSLTKRRPEDMSLLENEAERIGINVQNGKFCAGTMFMIRPACLQKIKDAEFDPSMWKQGASHIKGTLAHVYERILSIAVTDAGYRCITKAAYTMNIPRVFIHRKISPALKQIFTFDRYGEDAKKCLIIFGKRIMLE